MPRGGKRSGAGRPKGSATKNGAGATADEHSALASKIRCEYSDLAIRAIADVMQDPKECGSTRIKAANLLLERGYGRPIEGPETSIWAPPELTEEERAHKEKLAKLNRESEISIARLSIL